MGRIGRLRRLVKSDAVSPPPPFIQLRPILLPHYNRKKLGSVPNTEWLVENRCLFRRVSTPFPRATKRQAILVVEGRALRLRQISALEFVIWIESVVTSVLD